MLILMTLNTFNPRVSSRLEIVAVKHTALVDKNLKFVLDLIIKDELKLLSHQNSQTPTAWRDAVSNLVFSMQFYNLYK